MPPRPYNRVPPLARGARLPHCRQVSGRGPSTLRHVDDGVRPPYGSGVEQGDQAGGGRDGGPAGARLGDAAAPAGELPHPGAGGAGAGGPRRSEHPVERPARSGTARALGTLARLAGPHDRGQGEPGLGAAGTLPRGGACPRPGQATRRLTMSGLAVTVLSVVLSAAGAAMVAATTLSAVQTLVVPRATPMRLTRWVFRTVRVVFNLRSKRAKDYDAMDRAMALYSLISLLILVVAWLVIIGAGYVLMFLSLGVRPLRQAFILSGSSLFTLGFAVPKDLPTTALAFSEASFGIGLIALLLSYLPSIYASFSRREAAVAGLDVRAGSPPSAADLLIRHSRIDGLDHLDDVWRTWETWFTDIEETHTSIPAIVFFRSPDPMRSWVTAAGAVLDAASITASTLDLPRPVEAQLCIRAGYIDQLKQEGVPVKPDREQAWRDFAGWRVNYDSVVLALAALTVAPPAKWSSDRSLILPPMAPLLHRRRSRL